MCTPCRRERLRRRKATLRLPERVEACRRIAARIADVADAPARELSVALELWLRLAEQCAEGDAQVERPLDDPGEEERLFRAFVVEFNAREALVEREREKWVGLSEEGRSVGGNERARSAAAGEGYVCGCGTTSVGRALQSPTVQVLK